MFLRPYEAALIKRDFRQFLESAETTDITVTYQKPVNPVYDEVYDRINADAWEEVNLTTRASQRIITPADEEILKFGILQSGDSLFFLLESVDLYDYEDKPTSIQVDGVPTEWEVVPRKNRAFYEHILFRLGNTQVAQVLASRLKQN